MGYTLSIFLFTDPCSRSVAVCKAKKQAYQHAVESAFTKVLLVVLETGKAHVEVNTTLEEAPQPDLVEDSGDIKVCRSLTNLQI